MEKLKYFHLLATSLGDALTFKIEILKIQRCDKNEKWPIVRHGTFLETTPTPNTRKGKGKTIDEIKFKSLL